MNRLSIVVLFVAFCFFFSPKAKAGCVDYFDLGDQQCSGDLGCQGSYPMVSCTFGCISGICNPNGNGGVCCGQEFSYAQIFPDGQGNCHNIECGGGFGLLPHEKRKKLNARAKKRISPNAALLAYKLPRLVFIPNSCDHTYSALLQDYSQLPSVGGN